MMLFWVCFTHVAFEIGKSTGTLLLVQPLGKMSEVRFLDPKKEQVIFRFYCITRLNKIMHVVLFLLNSTLQVSDTSSFYVDASSLYADKTIIELWDDLNAYKHMDTNDAYIRHFILSVLFFLSSQKNTDRQLQSFLENDLHHTNIEQLNIEELLQAIDIIVDNINHLNHHYQESGLSFKSWLQTYWWIPTLIITSFFLKMLKYYYHEEIAQN